MQEVFVGFKSITSLEWKLSTVYWLEVRIKENVVCFLFDLAWIPAAVCYWNWKRQLGKYVGFALRIHGFLRTSAGGRQQQWRVWYVYWKHCGNSFVGANEYCVHFLSCWFYWKNQIRVIAFELNGLPFSELYWEAVYHKHRVTKTSCVAFALPS